jgi:RNA recognition motif-containing protein
MPNDDEAQAAIAALNEKELDGRVIVVKPANPKPATGNE